MQMKCKFEFKYLRNVRKKCIDRKIAMMISFLCRMKRNRNEVLALDATRLTLKVLEKGLSSNEDSSLRGIEIFSLCNKIYNRNDITIGDALKIKEALNLTDSEAVSIFLS